MNILFICTGNTCRSPMAEVIMQSKKPEYNVLSAGISAQDNAPMNVMAQKTIEKNHLSKNHIAQTVTAELMAWADYVFTMTATHKVMLEIAYPTHIHKIYTLKEFTKKDTELTVDIADPFGHALEVYEETFNALEKDIKQAIRKLEQP